jgi:hypothetical protein
MTDKTVSYAIERGIYFLFVNRTSGSLLAGVIIEVKRACVHLFPVADFHLDIQSPFGTSELWLNCCLQVNALIELG